MNYYAAPDIRSTNTFHATQPSEMDGAWSWSQANPTPDPSDYSPPQLQYLWTPDHRPSNILQHAYSVTYSIYGTGTNSNTRIESIALN